MAKAKELPSQEFLLECFDYDKETGDLIWKERPREHFKNVAGQSHFNSRCSGKIAGGNSISYCKVKINGFSYLSHRIIWKLVTGNDPISVIDHIDRNGFNNKFDNLRDVSLGDNSENKGLVRNNLSGITGVSYAKNCDKWKATITTKNTIYHLGVFETKEAAIEARLSAENNKHLLVWNSPKKPKVKVELTQEILNRYLQYDHETGVLTWKIRTPDEYNNDRSCATFNSKYASKIAGCLNSNSGYVTLGLLGHGCVRAHRIIWTIITGNNNPMVIDHINGIKHDNRWCNLREVTQGQNMMNCKNRDDGSSKYKGVHWHNVNKRWISQIAVNSKVIYIGSYHDELSAHNAYTEAAKIHHGQFMRNPI